MGQSADQLRQEIAQKRGDAAQKIDAIQNQVEDAVHKVEDTAEQVKENFNIRHQIEERPLLSLGAALIAGFALGGVIGGGNEHQPQQAATSANQGQWQPPQQQGSITGAIQHLAKESGIESTISDMASALLATLTDKVKHAVDESVPGFAAKLQQTRRSEGGSAARVRAAEQASAATTDASGRPVVYYPTPGGAAPNVHD